MTPGDVIVGIGPSIGPCCFEVGEEVVEAAREGLGDLTGLIEPGKQAGKYLLNLWEANRRQLRQVGVEVFVLKWREFVPSVIMIDFFPIEGTGEHGTIGAGIMLNYIDGMVMEEFLLFMAFYLLG